MLVDKPKDKKVISIKWIYSIIKMVLKQQGKIDS